MKPVYLVIGHSTAKNNRFSPYVIEGYEKVCDAYKAADAYNLRAVIDHTDRIYTIRVCEIYPKFNDE